MINSFNCLNQTAHRDPETQPSDSLPESGIRDQFKDEFNCLYQSPSSVNSNPKNTPRITNMQEMYNNSIFVNFLHSMFPN